METSFKTGDIVQLKSGGPKMTVDETYEDRDGTPILRCKWFAGAKAESSNFKAAMVVPVETVAK